MGLSKKIDEKVNTMLQSEFNGLDHMETENSNDHLLNDLLIRKSL